MSFTRHRGLGRAHHAQSGDATRLAKEAVEQGYELVAGYGGDGTQMEVANGLLGTGIPQAILPGGTGNAMAHDLTYPYQPAPGGGADHYQP